MNCSNIEVLDELQKLENMCGEYSGELKFLSKKIRRDIWISGKNDYILSKMLKTFNVVFECMYNITGEFSLGTIIEYVLCLSKYGIFINSALNATYYQKLIDDIQMESARLIIEEQWKDIYASKDGMKTFIEIFDDIFTKCINLYKDKFFHELKSTDVLCRAVRDWNHDTDRFIPWPNKTNNRWNPPGKTYLYLSFSEKESVYSDKLSLNEYICLQEIRAEKGEKFSFCKFEPITQGNILDLSYNAVSFGQLKGIVSDYQQEMTQKMIDEMMSDPNLIEKYAGNKRKLKRDIKKKQKKNPIDESIIQESYAKQYLKMVCNCIYKKVDESSEDKKEKAYKSFHILSEYLENKGVTGIIYPCTRDNTISGKNLVLFRKEDAVPVENSIREIIY